MPESVRLYNLCKGMNWCHLPNAGGIYDQDPELLDEFLELFSAQARHDKEQEAIRERERARNERKVNVRN